MRRRSKLLILFIALLSIVSFALTGCGGGGGGGGAPSQPPSQPPSPGPAKQSTTVSGSAVVGLSSLAAGLKKQQSVTQSAISLSGANVVIKSYDSNGNFLDSKETVTTDGGKFTVNITTIETGGYITISVTQGNYTRFEKTFTYKTLNDLKKLDIIAELDPLLTKVVDISQNWNWTASGDKVVSIAVVENARGSKQIVSGADIKTAKASGGNVIWQIDLPYSVLKQAGAEQVTVKIKNYNPAQSEEARRFPSDIDISGNRLVSAGFDFVDIKTNTGGSIPITKGSINIGPAIDPSTFKIIRQIPDCSLIRTDEDPTKDGYQVGFYFLRNGKWKKLGTATLYTDSNATELYTGGCTDTNRPYAVLTAKDLESDIDLTQLSWCNLDYVVTGNIKIGCISGSVNSVKRDTTKEPLKGLYLYLEDLKDNNNNTVNGFMASYTYTKDDGRFQIEFPYSGTLSNPQAVISYTDPFTWQWKRETHPLSSTDQEGCYVLDVNIPDPYQCEVKGKVLKGGSPAVNRLVQVYQEDTWYGWRSQYTDNNGDYSIKVVCNTDYVLTVGNQSKSENQSKSFNVNGSTDNDEASDSNNVVTMKDITLQNQPPYAYAYAWNTSVNEGDKVQLYSWAWDPDYDPLTYNWSAESGCGTFNNSSSQYPIWTAPTITTDPKECKLTLTVSDGQGGTASQDITITVYKPANRPPVIDNLIVPSSVTGGKTYYLYAYAHDPDYGDTVTYSWSADCGTFDNSSSSSPRWTAPSVSSKQTCNLTLTVSDNSDNNNPSVQKIMTVTVNPNKPPVILSINAPSTVPKNKSVTIYASAYDPDGDTLTYSWSANCGTFTDTNSTTSTNQNPTWKAPSSKGTCKLTLTLSDNVNPRSSSVDIQVVDTPPVINTFNVPDTARVGDTLTLYVTATDPDGDLLTYTWYVNGTQIGTGSSVTWSPIEQGTYLVEVKVSDGTNPPVSQSKNVVVSGSTSVDIGINSLFNFFKRR